MGMHLSAGQTRQPSRSSSRWACQPLAAARALPSQIKQWSICSQNNRFAPGGKHLEESHECHVEVSSCWLPTGETLAGHFAFAGVWIQQFWMAFKDSGPQLWHFQQKVCLLVYDTLCMFVLWIVCDCLEKFFGHLWTCFKPLNGFESWNDMVFHFQVRHAFRKAGGRADLGGRAEEETLTTKPFPQFLQFL